MLPDCTSIGIYAGRLTEDKGIVKAAQAIADLPGVGLVIAGSGPSRKKLEEIADSSANIVLLGQITNSMHFAAAADFGILLTSDPGEGRPLFALECVAVGVPVIANVHSAAVDDLIHEVGLGPVLAIDPSAPNSISSAIRTVEKFAPIELDWTTAAAVFDSAVRSP
ncbi:hypothetical protein NicSoilB11_31460 [Arthrobacter sp. NicSoilB11]|nr:hypothetical protein NicSoilB11_31460 [Arthrobacter sp. NicSoilB11]